MELFCNFKWEFGDDLTSAIMMNWLVNKKGVPGHFVEGDLMQEHFNFWLEDMGQHKGTEFEEPFYREVLSPNVDDFLGLKDEMEDNVALQRRSKQHGSTGVDNELRAVMDFFREHQVNHWRPGRNEAEVHQDDFAIGVQVLTSGKVSAFVEKSCITSTVTNMHGENTSAETVSFPLPDIEEIDEETEALSQSEELRRDLPNNAPHHQIALIDGQLCTMGIDTSESDKPQSVHTKSSPSDA